LAGISLRVIIQLSVRWKSGLRAESAEPVQIEVLDLEASLGD